MSGSGQRIQSVQRQRAEGGSATAKTIEATAAFPAAKRIAADPAEEKFLHAMPGGAIDAVGAGTLAGEYFVFVGDCVHGPQFSAGAGRKSIDDMIEPDPLV